MNDADNVYSRLYHDMIAKFTIVIREDCNLGRVEIILRIISNFEPPQHRNLPPSIFCEAFRAIIITPAPEACWAAVKAVSRLAIEKIIENPQEAEAEGLSSLTAMVKLDATGKTDWELILLLLSSGVIDKDKEVPCILAFLGLCTQPHTESAPHPSINAIELQNEGFVQWICTTVSNNSASFGNAFRRLLRYNTEVFSEESFPGSLRALISSTLRDAWDPLDEAEKAFYGSLIEDLVSSENHVWLPFVLRDHWRPVEESPNLYPLPRRLFLQVRC